MLRSQDTVGQQALAVLAYLRDGEIDTDLAVGFGISATAVFRYNREALEVLGARTAGLKRWKILRRIEPARTTHPG